jgi:hypothetical protein
VPSACGLVGRLRHAPHQLVHFGYIISYTASRRGTMSRSRALAVYNRYRGSVRGRSLQLDSRPPGDGPDHLKWPLRLRLGEHSFDLSLESVITTFALEECTTGMDVPHDPATIEKNGDGSPASIMLVEPPLA